MQIVFTIDQVQQLLNALGEIPGKYGINLITFIKQVAEPQVAAQQHEPEAAASTEVPADEQA